MTIKRGRSAPDFQFIVEKITVPPPGEREDGIGWAEVFILFRAPALGYLRPLVRIEVPLPYDDGWTFRAARKAVLDRARAILAAGAIGLDRATLEELEPVRPDQSP